MGGVKNVFLCRSLHVMQFLANTFLVQTRHPSPTNIGLGLESIFSLQIYTFHAISSKSCLVLDTPINHFMQGPNTEPRQGVLQSLLVRSFVKHPSKNFGKSQVILKLFSKGLCKAEKEGASISWATNRSTQAFTPVFFYSHNFDWYLKLEAIKDGVAPICPQSSCQNTFSPCTCCGRKFL